VDYPASALENNPAIIAARTVLEAANTGRGIPLTKTQKLVVRKFVDAFADAVPWGAAMRQEWQAMRVNRPDEYNDVSLFLMRYWLEMAGLIRTYKGRLVCTKKGRRVLHPDQAPALLREVLTAIFVKSDMAQFDPWFDVPAIEAFTPAFIYGLGQSGRDWNWLNGAIDLLLPRSKAKCDAEEYAMLAHAAVTRVLQPLYYCGIVEFRPAPNIPARRVTNLAAEYRVAPLYDLVFEFNLT